MDYQFFGLSAFINGKWRRFSIHGNGVSMDGFIVHIEHPISGVAFGRDQFFLQFSDVTTDGDTTKDHPVHNVWAYDYNGMFLYNIDEIIPSGDGVYNHIYIEDHAYIDKPIDGQKHSYELIKGHEYLYCYSALRSLIYIVDITDRIFVTRQDTR